MQTTEAIDNRRSIRKFKNTIVSEKILESAIKYGTKAPSAHNYQPWFFKILSKEELNIIADILYNKTKDIKGSTASFTSSIIKNCNNGILVYLTDKENNRDMNIISIGAAIENIILYLTDLNLGTLWIGDTNIIDKELVELTKIDYEPISLILVGQKDQEPHERPRKRIEDIMAK